MTLKIISSLLTKKEIKVLSLYYFDMKKHKDIAKTLNVDRSRITQILISARKKLTDAGYEIPSHKQIHRMMPFETETIDRLCIASNGTYKWMDV